MKKGEDKMGLVWQYNQPLPSLGEIYCSRLDRLFNLSVMKHISEEGKRRHLVNYAG
jgi:hypothetical protein